MCAVYAFGGEVVDRMARPGPLAAMGPDPETAHRKLCGHTLSSVLFACGGVQGLREQLWGMRDFGLGSFWPRSPPGV